MLRVTITETPGELRWTLQGQLTSPWIGELRSSWRKARPRRQRRNSIVDLSGVTLIDKCGERVLRAMADAGAEFVAGGVYTRHVVESLKTRRKRRWCNFIAWLFVLAWLAHVPPLMHAAALSPLSGRVRAARRLNARPARHTRQNRQESNHV